MGLFNFKKTDETTIKSINDLFKFNFTDVPDDTFVEIIEHNEQGDEIRKYRKILSYKECGLFDTLEVYLIGQSQKNIILSTTDIKRISINDVKKIVDTLFLFLGEDSENNGRFNADDKNSIERSFYWSRMWPAENSPFSCMFMLMPPSLELSLLSIENIK